MNKNIFTGNSPVAKAARRRRYRRNWMRKRRAQKGEYWRLKVGPGFAAMVHESKPTRLSFNQWLRRLIRSGLLAEAHTLARSHQPPAPAPAVPPYKIGRNDPCFCGSGLKFKRCCGKGSRSPR